MGEMGRCVTEAAVEAGATVEYGRTVTSCIIERGRVVGIRLKGGEEVRSGLVVSNLDPKNTFTRLLPAESVPPHLARRIAELPTNISSYKFLAVLSELPEWRAWDGDPMERARGGTILAHHRAEVAAAYDAVDAGIPPRAPVVSVSIPSAVDPTLAPAGYHTASIWVYPAPGRLASGPWREMRTETAESLIDQITEYAPNFRRSIEEYRFRTPEDIARMHGMTDGCIWHVQHEGSALLGNRPVPELSSYRAHLAGLYLCGAGQHPWGEVTGLPGHNAAQEILKDLA
jgi:phytoene dehydrogenase-like protein